LGESPEKKGSFLKLAKRGAEKGKQGTIEDAEKKPFKSRGRAKFSRRKNKIIHNGIKKKKLTSFVSKTGGRKVKNNTREKGQKGTVT